MNVETAIAGARVSAAQQAIAASAAGSAPLVEYISFAIGDDQYGVDIMSVREIKGWSGVTHLPKQPEYVRGVLNLRGVMVPIIDLRCRFGQGMTEASAMHVVIIVQIGERLVGLMGDRVLDIVSFEVTKIQSVPKIGNKSQAAFLSGLITPDDAMIALIDLEHLLMTEDIHAGGQAGTTEQIAA
jgi:purine-binding chemotaxis protein CheW